MSEHDVTPLLPPGWPRPKGYSNGLRVPAGHDLIFVAGMVGWDETETVVSTDFVEQFARALENVVAVLAQADAGPEHVVRLTMYVADVDLYARRLSEVGQAYRRIMGRRYPVMTLVEVSRLLEDGALVELEATAAVPPVTGS